MTNSQAKRLLFAGYGYTARAFRHRLEQAHPPAFVATTRSADKADAFRNAGLEPVMWGDAGALSATDLDGVDAILVSAPPAGESCSVLPRLADAIGTHARAIRWIGYLSSNGVYGDHDGAWVDEGSDLKPRSARARARVRAEADWASFAASYALPLVIFRLPGIYGPGRSAIDSVRKGTAQRIVKEGQMFSRAHVDDIAAALTASLANPAAGDLFNVADDEPAPPQDVVTYACDLLGVEPPPLTPFEAAEMSDMARSFYADNKRVSNTLMKERLGVDLLYPTYRDGLDAILAAEKMA